MKQYKIIDNFFEYSYRINSIHKSKSYGYTQKETWLKLYEFLDDNYEWVNTDIYHLKATLIRKLRK